MPSIWCVFRLHVRPYPVARREIFPAFKRDRSLTPHAVSLQFMDGMPAAKAIDMAEATCGKALLSNMKASSRGSAGGQARHRPQGR